MENEAIVKKEISDLSKRRQIDDEEFVRRDIDDKFDDDKYEDYEEEEKFDEAEAVEYTGINVNKDYDTEHKNFINYIKKSRKKISGLRIGMIVMGLLLVAAIGFILFIYTVEKSENGKSFFSKKKKAEVSTKKLVENLSSKTGEITKDSFKASVDNSNGYEYLKIVTTINGEEVSIFFQNEFPEEKSGSNLLKSYISKGSEVIAMNLDYDLKDINSALPMIVNFTDGGQGFLWVNWNGDIPTAMSLYDVKNMEKSGSVNLFATLSYYFDVQDAGEAEHKLKLIHGDKVLLYQVSEDVYNLGRGNGGSAIGFTDGFKGNLDADKLEFSTYITLGEGGYVGEYSASMTFSSGGIKMGEQSFRPYIDANYPLTDYTNRDKFPTLTPQTEKWENPFLYKGYLIKRYEKVPAAEYVAENIADVDNGTRVYTDGNGSVLTTAGVDVSTYQGNIDWNKLKASGVEYAIIRAGYRGYSKGAIVEDDKFRQNIKGATEAGLKVGVYIFTQAINEAEAREEAKFLLDAVSEYDIKGPFVIDTEYYDADPTARANNLTRAERTTVVKAFCDAIKDAGKRPMVYAGTEWLLFGLNWDEFAEYDVWHAYYGDTPILPYKFAIWQYSMKGLVSGIGVDVDLDMMFEDVFQ